MSGRIDVHAHLLPGIDDGCATVEQSVACARMLVDAGYSHAFCTPHVWWNLPQNTPANIVRWTGELQAQLDAAGVPLKLMPGGELNLRPEIMVLQKAEIPTYGMLGRYCIFDLWANNLPPFFASVVSYLRKDLGLTVVLAHPERMEALWIDVGLIDRIQDMGILLQGNLQCFSDLDDMMTRILVERWLKEGRYFLLGTDTHNPATLPCRLDGLHRALDLVGADAVNKLTIDNPRLLIEP